MSDTSGNYFVKGVKPGNYQLVPLESQKSDETSTSLESSNKQYFKPSSIDITVRAG
jgi:hypothetical protein